MPAYDDILAARSSMSNAACPVHGADVCPLSPEPQNGRAGRVQVQVQMREPFWNSGGYGLSFVVMSCQCQPAQAVRATCSPLSQQWQKLRSRNSSSRQLFGQ